MSFMLAFVLVKPHKTAAVVEAARKAGATEAAIYHASGTGVCEKKVLSWLLMMDETDLVVLLLCADQAGRVLGAVKAAGEFHKPRTGVAFTLPMEQAPGLADQVSTFLDSSQESSH